MKKNLITFYQILSDVCGKSEEKILGFKWHYLFPFLPLFFFNFMSLINDIFGLWLVIDMYKIKSLLETSKRVIEKFCYKYIYKYKKHKFLFILSLPGGGSILLNTLISTSRHVSAFKRRGNFYLK